LEAVGNSIGRFLSVDAVSLKSPVKKMAKTLVEVDVHAGLLEVLEIEWQDLVFVQRLDYLGIPSRCTYCRRTKHLRKGCTNIFGSLVDDDSSNDILGNTVTPVEEDPNLLVYPALGSKDSPSAHNSSFVGKLKYYCPKLYNSLSAWEREHLNTILFPE